MSTSLWPFSKYAPQIGLQKRNVALLAGEHKDPLVQAFLVKFVAEKKKKTIRRRPCES
jgi:hypothetical protein